MAGNSKAEDDDEGFGDFTFASVPRSNPRTNGTDLFSKKTNTAGDDEDDDWGDFVKPTSLTRSESLPVKQLDPLDFVSNHRNEKSQNDETVPGSAPSRVQNPWTKPTGAIPLSIFGKEEEEEKEKEGSGWASLLFNGMANLKIENNELKKDNKGSDLNVSDLFSNLYKKNEQSNHSNHPKPDSNGWGLNLESVSSSRLDLKNNGYSDSNGLSSAWEEDDEWDFKGAVSDLPTGDSNSKIDQQITAEHGPKSHINLADLSWGAMGSNVKGLSTNMNGVKSSVNQLGSSLFDESANPADDDVWEFKDAVSGTQSVDGNSKVNGNGSEISGVKHMSGFGNKAAVPTDLFAVSENTSQKSGEWGFGLDFSESSVIPNGTISNSYSESKEKDVSDIGFSSSAGNGHVDDGQNSWAFKDAFSGTGSKDKNNEVKIESHKEPLPLSLFGEEETVNNDTSNQDVFDLSASTASDGVKKNPISNVSINDLISSLYSQAQQNASVNHAESPSENGLGSRQQYLESNSADPNDGDFDDDSWEFKGAFAGIADTDQTSVPGQLNSHICSTKVEQKDYVDFYSKIKDELCCLAQWHVYNLKKARGAAALAGEDAKVDAFDKDIQELNDELHCDNILSKEVLPDDFSSSNIHINKFVEVLQEPKFRMLESEYHLSEKLLLAEKDWRSAIGLLKHVASTSKILTLGSMEEQSDYVSTWYRLVSVCAQELRHGAFIWKQSLDKNIQDQILSDPRGRQFISSIGEVYRAVEVLGCSAKLYKPWVLLCSANAQEMFTLLSECSALWLSSGLEEALLSISDPLDVEYNGTPLELLKSIKHICDLDTLALYNNVFSSQEPTCQLSRLTAGAVRGTKMVTWNGEHYFLPLANLWANLVSSDPPSLSHIHVVG